jgi:hypothetical protein
VSASKLPSGVSMYSVLLPGTHGVRVRWRDTQPTTAAQASWCRREPLAVYPRSRAHAQFDPARRPPPRAAPWTDCGHGWPRMDAVRRRAHTEAEAHTAASAHLLGLRLSATPRQPLPRGSTAHRTLAHTCAHAHPGAAEHMPCAATALAPAVRLPLAPFSQVSPRTYRDEAKHHAMAGA